MRRFEWTKITYAIPSGTHVKLYVYDGFGREVSVVVDKYQPAGTYEVNFDGQNLSTGYYFYKLEADDFIQTKEMLLLK